MRRTLFIAVALAMLIAAVNDVALMAKSAYELHDQARGIAQVGAVAAKKAPGAGTSGWPATYGAASSAGVTVTHYQQDDERITIDVTKPVTGTWVYGPVAGVLGGKSYLTLPTVSSRSQVLYR